VAGIWSRYAIRIRKRYPVLTRRKRMSPQRLSDLRDDAFDALIEQHIDQVAAGAGNPPIATALAIWLDRLADEAPTTITLEVAISGDQVALIPVGATDPVIVHGNEIIISGHRIVLQPIAHAESS
jgi:hypothetical protein